MLSWGGGMVVLMQRIEDGEEGFVGQADGGTGWDVPWGAFDFSHLDSLERTIFCDAVV